MKKKFLALLLVFSFILVSASTAYASHKQYMDFNLTEYRELKWMYIDSKDIQSGDGLYISVLVVDPDATYQIRVWEEGNHMNIYEEDFTGDITSEELLKELDPDLDYEVRIQNMSNVRVNGMLQAHIW